jgi:serine protease Do
VILKINGTELRDSNELPSLVAGIAPGTSVNLEIWRNHASKDVSVTLGALEDKRTASTDKVHEQGGKLGLAVRPLSPDEQKQGNLKSGLVVERSSGPAADAGIQQGDVVLAANGAPVTSADDLKSAVEKSKGHIALLIQRGEARIFVPVRVG